MVLNELRLAHDNSYQSLSYNSILYLDLIVYQKDCTVSTLAELLHVAKSAVTLKVKELEKLGLVEKRRSEQDKRVFYLYANPRIVQEYKALDRVLYGALDEVEAKYSPAQLALLCGMFDTINQHFNRAYSLPERK